MRYLFFLLLLAAQSPIWAQQGNNTQNQNTAKTQEEADDRVILSLGGKVVNTQTGRGVSGVEVLVYGVDLQKTDAYGNFSVQAHPGDAIIFNKEGFYTAQIDVTPTTGFLDVDLQAAPEDASVTKTEQFNRYLDSARSSRRNSASQALQYVGRAVSLQSPEFRLVPDQRKDAYELLGDINSQYGQYDIAAGNYAVAYRSRGTTALLVKQLNALLDAGNAKAARELWEERRGKINANPREGVTLAMATARLEKQEGNTQRAILNYRTALRAAQRSNLPDLEARIENEIGQLESQLGNVVQAETAFINSIGAANNLQPRASAVERLRVADNLNSTADYEREIEIREEVLEELKTIPEAKEEELNEAYTADLNAALQNYKIGRAYMAKGDNSRALTYLNRSEELAREANDVILLKDATRFLGDAHDALGNVEASINYNKTYLEILDGLYLSKEQELSQAARTRENIASAQNRIASLEQERELASTRLLAATAQQQLANENTTRQRWTIYGLIALMLLLGALVYTLYRNNRQQKLANNLLALKSLRSQMNPHFIFNALNSVNNYIAASDERSANRYLTRFSTLMRTVLENTERDFIPMPEELALLRAYLDLEHQRFQDQFEYSIQVDEDIDLQAYQIPPMLLQPYLENAIWHGLRYKKDLGHLRMHLSQDPNKDLIITITDDGVGRTRSQELKSQHQMKTHQSKGMATTRDRIQILNSMYGNTLSVDIADAGYPGDIGTRVTVRLKSIQ